MFVCLGFSFIDTVWLGRKLSEGKEMAIGILLKNEKCYPTQLNDCAILDWTSKFSTRTPIWSLHKTNDNCASMSSTSDDDIPLSRELVCNATFFSKRSFFFFFSKSSAYEVTSIKL